MGGAHIALSDRAEEAANYLSTVQWGQEVGESPTLPTHRVITAEVTTEEGIITIEELDRAIKKLKQRKCGGPDGTSIELFKAMDSDNRQEVLKIVNQWWQEE